jgi:CopA family copper-resistance protein
MRRKGTQRRISRRRFVQGVAAGGLMAGLDLLRWPSLALAGAGAPAVLSGTNFDLTVEETPVNFTGRGATAVAVNGMVPGPLLRFREGDTVTISVANRLKSPTSIHWHGLRLPADMDGVPGVSFRGIAAGETFVYRYPVVQHGTYWYHSHMGFEEQVGLYGPLIIDPAGKDRIGYDREYAILLSDWTDENPATVLSNLKQESDYYNYHQRTVGTFISDVRKRGLAATVSNRLTWGRMNMSPADILDVSGATYTYLLNGHPPAANWTALFRPGERVRLRFINGSSMTYFDVRIPGLTMTVVQADGNDVEPVAVDEFRMAVAETYDIIVHPTDASAYTIFAQCEDRTGYARATLAPRLGMTAVVPPMDPRPVLTMVDMGMGNMAGAEMAGSSGMNPNGAHGAMHTGHSHAGARPAIEVSRSTELGTPGGISQALAAQFALRQGMTGNRAPGQPGPQTAREFPGPDMGHLRAPRVPPPAISLGPEVNNIAMNPTERLSSPGAGLNHNGRRVLTYADLRAAYGGNDPRPPDREIELHLTGNMERFIWGFDGRKFSEAEPIRLKLGERVRFVLINDTMMEHPIHLHGLWSELENSHGAFRPYKHTISVKPGERVNYLVSADTPGQWAYHCHLLYHMESGMFRKVIVA